MNSTEHSTGPAAAPVPKGGLVISTVNDDRELIALGEQLRAAWDEEKKYNSPDLPDDGKFEAASEVCSGIVDQIQTYRAHTVQGLKVKSLALAWCYGSDDIQIDGDTTDVRLANSIASDVLALTVVGSAA